jgi:hypothetical protein
MALGWHLCQQHPAASLRAAVRRIGQFCSRKNSVDHQFSVDALYPHREHLPAKVRTFIDVVAKNVRQTDWAREGERPGDSIKKAIAANSKQTAR